MQRGQKLSQIVTAKTKHLLASGLSQTETAKEVGISRKSANHISQANKADIEQLALQYIQDSIPLIRANHRKTLEIAQHVLSSVITDKKGQPILNPQGQPVPDIAAIESAKTILTLADKKEYRAMLVMGLVPSHTSSTVVNMLFAGQNSKDNKNLASVQKFLEWKRTEDLDAQEGEIIEDVGEKDRA